MKGLPKLSKKDCWILGVCGGLGEYFGVNSNILRALFVLCGFQLIPYLILALIMSYDSNENL
ncbi:MAG: PspC domain-containing protein [Clostridiales bacterium]|nr:PspC domain-containing protein [Clostridiales bacterium]MDD7346973.1 PspC domain-containing protein [Clostridiales bacterium]MDY4060533.1 PspC domain-containing protein [Anaerovoracaceae bacterium]